MLSVPSARQVTADDTPHAYAVRLPWERRWETAPVCLTERQVSMVPLHPAPSPQSQ